MSAETERVVLVSGSTRGLGRAIARHMGDTEGRIVNADADRASGQRALESAAAHYGRLDALVLDASECLSLADHDPGALQAFREAQRALVSLATPLMSPGARIVYVTSHQAHFVETAETMDEYVPVAKSKRAGELALRELVPQLEAAGIEFVVVSGDMIEGTITATLLNRLNPGAIEGRRQEVGKLYSVSEFAAEIALAAVEPVPADHTKLVGDVSGFGA